MALEYTEEKRNSLDKETIIQLFLVQQEQLKQIDHHLQLVLEQLADLKRHRFGRSSEIHGTDGQISFMEVDGQIVFFMRRRLFPRKTLMTAGRMRPIRPGGDRKKSRENGKRTWKGSRSLWWNIPWKKRSWRNDSDRKAGSSSPMRYTADTVLLRQRWKWRNIM